MVLNKLQALIIHFMSVLVIILVFWNVNLMTENVNHWRASETLSAVIQFENLGYLFVYIYVGMYVCHFVL